MQMVLSGPAGSHRDESCGSYRRLTSGSKQNCPQKQAIVASVSILLSVSREARSHAEHWAQNLDRSFFGPCFLQLFIYGQEYAVGGGQSFVAGNNLTATCLGISDSISVLAKIAEIII